MKKENKLAALCKAVLAGDLAKEELTYYDDAMAYINHAYASYINRKYPIREDIAPILDKKLAELKEVMANDIKSCVGIDYGVDEGTYVMKGTKTFQLKSTPVYTQPQFYQTLGRVYRNPNQTKTMNAKNLLPFDLCAALRHPERVYNTASGTQNIKSISVLASGNVAVEYHESIGGAGYIYTREIAEKLLRIVAPEPTIVPWTLETIPCNALAYVYRKKEKPTCVTLLRCVDQMCVWFGGTYVYYQDLLDQWEWAYNINGPWNPCGVKS